MTARSLVRALILSWMVAALVACGEDTPSPQEQPPSEVTGVISGIVTDGDTATPIEGATVSVTPGALEVTTDPQGAFLLADVALGSYQVDASADGYASATMSGVEVLEGQAAHVELALDELTTFASTCVSCHLRQEQLLASLEQDPPPEVEGEGGSAGEG